MAKLFLSNISGIHQMQSADVVGVDGFVFHTHPKHGDPAAYADNQLELPRAVPFHCATMVSTSNLAVRTPVEAASRFGVTTVLLPVGVDPGYIENVRRVWDVSKPSGTPQRLRLLPTVFVDNADLNRVAALGEVVDGLVLDSLHGRVRDQGNRIKRIAEVVRKPLLFPVRSVEDVALLRPFQPAVYLLDAEAVTVDGETYTHLLGAIVRAAHDGRGTVPSLDEQTPYLTTKF